MSAFVSSSSRLLAIDVVVAEYFTQLVFAHWRVPIRINDSDLVCQEPEPDLAAGWGLLLHKARDWNTLPLDDHLVAVFHRFEQTRELRIQFLHRQCRHAPSVEERAAVVHGSPRACCDSAPLPDLVPYRTQAFSIERLREKAHMATSITQRNHVTVSGRGTQPMLFAHGFGCDQRMWRLVAPAFEDEYRVVLFDYVGLGRSDASVYDPVKYHTLEGYVQDVLDICAELELKDAIYVGHSVSAMVGILAAIRSPEHFSRLILVGPSPRYIDEPPGYYGGFKREDIDGLLDLMDRNYIGWAHALAANVMKNPERPELTEELADVFCSTDPRVARTFAEATFFADNRADLPDLTIPALVLQCTDDSIAPDSVGAFVHEQLPHAQFRKLAATGHCPQLSHPAELIQVMRDYLA